MKGTVEARFWAKVDKTGDCWTWIGAVSGGYGELNVNGVPRDAHRLAWELHFGPIPDGLWVLHRCDNGPCVRPDHLWLGTVTDNNRDMFAKGRNRSTGRRNHPRTTHCKNGHELVAENVYLRLRRRDGHPDSLSRECRTCERLRHRVTA